MGDMSRGGESCRPRKPAAGSSTGGNIGPDTHSRGRGILPASLLPKKTEILLRYTTWAFASYEVAYTWLMAVHWCVYLGIIKIYSNLGRSYFVRLPLYTPS